MEAKLIICKVCGAEVTCLSEIPELCPECDSAAWKDVEPKPLTDDQKDKYLENSGVCPYCGSEDIEGEGSYDYGDDSIFAKVHCYSCGQNWEDVYVLAGVDDEETTHVLNNAQWKWLQEIAKVPIKGELDYRKLDVHDATGFIRTARDIVGGA